VHSQWGRWVFLGFNQRNFLHFLYFYALIKVFSKVLYAFVYFKNIPEILDFVYDSFKKKLKSKFEKIGNADSQYWLNTNFMFYPFVILSQPCAVRLETAGHSTLRAVWQLGSVGWLDLSASNAPANTARDPICLCCCSSALPTQVQLVVHRDPWVPLDKAAPQPCRSQPRLGSSQNHRITESQNSRGWKGPLWVI